MIPKNRPPTPPGEVLLEEFLRDRPVTFATTASPSHKRTRPDVGRQSVSTPCANVPRQVLLTAPDKEWITVLIEQQEELDLITGLTQHLVFYLLEGR